MKELGLDDCSTPTGNSTYTLCHQMLSEDVVNSHDTFMKSLCIELSNDDTRGYHTFIGPPSYKTVVQLVNQNTS